MSRFAALALRARWRCRCSVTPKPRVDPIPAEARSILRRIAEELRRTPRPVLADPAEVAKIIARTADRIEGVAAISRPPRSPRSWRAPDPATF